jgi:hypothetical protein
MSMQLTRTFVYAASPLDSSATNVAQYVGRWTTSTDEMHKDGSFPGNRSPQVLPDLC